MQIKIVCLFSLGKGGGKMVGNLVVVLGGENQITIPKLRRLKWYVKNQIYVNVRAQGQVLIQIRTEYCTI